jgi:hypothetical protein
MRQQFADLTGALHGQAAQHITQVRVGVMPIEPELLQCKSSSGHDVGWDAIKEVTAGAARYQARFPGTMFRRLAVTNQRFTTGAREHAAANRVVLIERPQMEELLGKHLIHNHEFEDEVAESVPFLDAG